MRAVGLSKISPVEDFLDSEIDGDGFEQNIDEIVNFQATSMVARKTKASRRDLERVLTKRTLVQLNSTSPVVEAALDDNESVNLFALSVAKKAAIRMRAYRKKHENLGSAVFSNIVRDQSARGKDLRSPRQISNRDVFMEPPKPKWPSRVEKCFHAINLPVIPVGHRYKRRWDIFAVLLALISLFVVPTCIAFPAIFALYDTLVYSCDAVFFVDLVLNFREAYLDDDSFEVRDGKLVVERYLKGWFLFDFLSTVPFEVLLSGLVSEDGARFLLYNRIFRWLRVERKTNHWFISEASRILKLLLMFFYLAHLFACTFLAVSHFSDGDRWIDIAAITNQEMSAQYLVALYWAFATIGTVGYGDIAPVNPYERGFTIMCFFVGSVLYAIIFGTFSALIQNLDKRKQEYDEKLKRVDDFVRVNRLPPFIKSRLRKYLHANSHMKKTKDRAVFDGVPVALERDIMMYLYADIVKAAPILSNAGSRLLENIVMSFETQVFLMGDFLMREGDFDSELIFIIRGVCEIYKFAGEGEPHKMDFEEVFMNSIKVTERGIGAFIGEASLLYSEARGASVVAQTEVVQTIALTKEAFELCALRENTVFDNFKKEADDRKEENRHIVADKSTEEQNRP